MHCLKSIIYKIVINMNYLCYWLVGLALFCSVDGQYNQYVYPVQGQLGLNGYNPGNVPFPGLQLTPEVNRNSFYGLAAQDTGAENYAQSQLISQQLPLEHRGPTVSPLPVGVNPGQNQFSGNQIDVQVQGPSSTTFAPSVATSAGTAGSDNDIFSFIQGQLGSNTAKNNFENPFNFKVPAAGTGSGSSANSQTSAISSSSSGSSGGSSIASLLANSFAASSTPSPKPSSGLSGLSGLLGLLRPNGGSPLTINSAGLGSISNAPQESRVNLAGGLGLLSRFLELPAELLRLKIYFFTTFLRSLFTAKMNLVRAVLDNNIAILKAAGSVARGAQAGLSGASATLTEALSQNAEAIARNTDGLGSGVNNTFQILASLGADTLTNTRTIAGGIHRGTQGLLNGLSGSVESGSKIRELTKEISQNLAKRTENVGLQTGQFISDLKRKKIRQIEALLGLVNNGLKGDSNPLGGLQSLVPNVDILGLLTGSSNSTNSSPLGLPQLPDLSSLANLFGSNRNSTSDLLSRLSLNDLTGIEESIKNLGLDSSDLLALLGRFRRSALEEGIDPHLVLTNEELDRIVRNMKKSSSS